MSPQPLTDKTALVTGSGRGIGQAIAIAFAKAGANLILVARTEEQLNAVAEDIRATGRKALVIPTDVTDRAQVTSMAERVRKAGLWMFTQCLAEEVWEHGIDVNELIPGPVATNLTAGRMQRTGPPPFAPSENVKTPEDVVPLALFLATQPKGGPTAQSFSLTRRPI